MLHERQPWGPPPLTTISLSVCFSNLAGKTFDVLWNGNNQFAIHFAFHADGTMSSNQAMFDGAPWHPTSLLQFDLGRKNGSFVLWEFRDATEREAFRTDKKLYGMRLKKEAHSS
jgi:hypothetical protein